MFCDIMEKEADRSSSKVGGCYEGKGGGGEAPVAFNYLGWAVNFSL